MTLGKLIRLTREAKGLTLRAVEKSCGLSNALISQIETGWIDDLSLRNAKRLGGALGISLDEMANTRPVKNVRKPTSKMRLVRKHV